MSSISGLSNSRNNNTNNQNNQSPLKTSQSRSSSQLSKIDLRSSKLDSKLMVAQNFGHSFLETISSNESRYTSSPNFLARSKESEINSNLQTQLINVPKLTSLRGGGVYNQFESLSQSASSESQRGFNVADQIRLEQYQVKNYINPMTILEDSKEEDVSFNKTLTDQSPIPNRHGGIGGIFYDNKSSIDDGTRSLLHQMRGNYSHENTIGSNALKSSQFMGGGIAGNAKPNFNISTSTLSNQHLKFMGITPEKGKTQFLNTRVSAQMQDQELLDELGQTNGFDQKSNTQLQKITSLQDSDEHQQNHDDQFNIVDQRNYEQSNPNNNLMYSTFKSSINMQNLNKGGNTSSYQRNDPIRIDDNQFVTLNQIPEDQYYNGVGSNSSRNQFYSGRPSNISQNMPLNMMVGGGTFSDGQSSSNPTTYLNTPYQNQYQSRLVSPFAYNRKDNSSSILSSRCQCCQAPINVQHNRPHSGLSNIDTKNLNFYDKQDGHEVQTPQLASDIDQSTKIISNKDSEKASSYNAVLCNDCQSKILNKENFTPIIPSDLKTSGYTNNTLQTKSQIQQFDELQLNSNLSSIHVQGSNMAQHNIQNNLKFSSVMGQSELQHSYLTQSNQPGQMSHPLQVNSLLQNSDSISNPTLQSSSLHYLSYLSQNIGSQIKSQDDYLTNKYGLNNHDNYKLALKSFMNRQFERSAASTSDSSSIQYSRIFKERQTKRIFDSLQNIKSDYAKTYEELEAMHTSLLLSKIGNS
ncbi:UNKNOWN [Stylonychia lemnae]|uniref:Uncharacterized protein n=1 Tax=Stylonychia lemnae TaxID=5949 RepID=A0A078AZ17_STYLE|nr:UNKNOWN [Stylonychia lemnae]|eukprot:CDW86053.1 UNKNOWN [Stylonychia lemnae]